MLLQLSASDFLRTTKRKGFGLNAEPVLLLLHGLWSCPCSDCLFHLPFFVSVSVPHLTRGVGTDLIPRERVGRQGDVAQRVLAARAQRVASVITVTVTVTVGAAAPRHPRPTRASRVLLNIARRRFSHCMKIVPLKSRNELKK